MNYIELCNKSKPTVDDIINYIQSTYNGAIGSGYNFFWMQCSESLCNDYYNDIWEYGFASDEIEEDNSVCIKLENVIKYNREQIEELIITLEHNYITAKKKELYKKKMDEIKEDF